ncbi:unnamed protein product [Brugia timori]|uniref:Uncharacterized protein n=1 Tax=Brugia timori TaxID=42155 RepID=A0A0R3QDF9_9BILA|nr:unnamed protein product [Brugia timori]
MSKNIALFYARNGSRCRIFIITVIFTRLKYCIFQMIYQHFIFELHIIFFCFLEAFFCLLNF